MRKKYFDNKELSTMIYNNKIEIGKYALVFLGGVALGYGIKKIMDSSNFDDIKNNATSIINDYVTPTTEYIDVDIDDEEKEVMDVTVEDG